MCHDEGCEKGGAGAKLGRLRVARILFWGCGLIKNYGVCCFVVLIRYWGIVTVPGFYHERSWPFTLTTSLAIPVPSSSSSNRPTTNAVDDRGLLLWWIRCLGEFDWCCFYYFVRNISIFSDISPTPPFLWVCKAFDTNKSLSSAPLKQAPVPGCCHSSCVLIVHVCLCVCASVCACENV